MKSRYLRRIGRHTVSLHFLLTALVSLTMVGCFDETLVVDPSGESGFPHVVGAKSDDNSTVTVTFSRPMGTGAEDASNYRITRMGNSAPAALSLVSATFADMDHTAVRLTTGSQNDVSYDLSVVNVLDTQGRPLGGDNRAVPNPDSTTFVGTPPGADDFKDTDGDGLTDNAEQFGWLVTVLLANGQATTREVTSDPESADTDGDGLEDAVEKAFGTNPRARDTDADQLSDYRELNDIYSSPYKQDTDRDGLEDGLEFNFFLTSPVLDDTDGDQILDSDEVLLGNRNARVADLPLPGIEIGDVDMQLDVRFVATSSVGSRVLDSKSVSSTLTQSDSRSVSNTDSTTHEAFAKFGAEQSYEVGLLGTKAGAKLSFEGGYSGQWTSSVTKSSASETQKSFEKSKTTDVESTQDETVSREVVGASMKLIVNIKTLGDIAFTIRNMQITAFMQDPRNPARLIPIATLVPEVSAGTPNEFNLGPLVPSRGPFIFANEQIFPSLVENLMRDPRGLIFKIANFDIEDELGRNFAFTSQGINDRTGALVIDFGAGDPDGDGFGEATERLRVSTSAGRPMADSNGDGIVDTRDERTVFDDRGRHVGITVREALENIVGLQHYDEDVTPSSSLTQFELDESYSTHTAMIDTDADGVVDDLVRTIWRVRGVSKELGNPLKQWEVLTPNGIDQTVDIDERLIGTGQGITFAFVQDLDDDGLPARWEFIYGCSDNSADTDDDLLDDRLETFDGWPINVRGQRSYRGYGSCARADSDGDGLSDAEEANRTVDLDTDGDGVADVFGAVAATDAKNDDTDEDGVSDFDEQNGYLVELRFEFDSDASACVPADPTNDRVVCTSDPLNADTDGDTLSDGDELKLGTDPTVNDGDKFFDNDGDGLVNFLESQVGWTVTVNGVSETALLQGSESSRNVFSDPNNADTDGDGIDDRQERDLATDPSNRDTDIDGLADNEEIVITILGDGSKEATFSSNPLDADTDDDRRSDGAEVNEPWIVNVTGGQPAQVFSDPLDSDADFDQLLDLEEFNLGTHPQVADTDGDIIDDFVEANRPTNPLVPDQYVDFRYTNVKVVGDCDNGVGVGGQFRGTMSIRKNGGSNLVGYNLSGITVLQGKSQRINAGVAITLMAGDSVETYNSTDVYDHDPSVFNADEQLNEFSETFSYEQDNDVRKLKNTSDFGAECELETTLDITVILD